MKAQVDQTEFERLLKSLESRTRGEVVGLVAARLSEQEGARFALLADGLSFEALKFVAARTLLRAPLRRGEPRS